MTIEIEYIPHRTETVHEIVGEPEEDDKVLSTVEEEDAYGNVHTWHKVEREITITEEQYRVHTAGARGSKLWFYLIKQNDDGEWEVTEREMSHGRTNRTMIQKPESTETVREALREKHGIELVN